MTLLRLTPAMATHRGMRRRHNEDAVGYEYPTQYNLLESHGALFIVADGVGGLSAGDKASKMVVDKLQQYYYASDTTVDIDERLVDAIQRVNTDVFNELDRKGATTLVAVVIHHDTLVAASVGDSQIFRIQGDDITQLNEEDVLESDDENNGALTKAIGYRQELELETVSGKVRDGDKILLCSDGLTRYLDDDQIVRLSQVRDPRDSVRRMINQANADGGADNITALLVFVGETISADELADHQRAIAVRVAVDTDPMVRMEVQDKPNTQIPLSRPRSAIPEEILDSVQVPERTTQTASRAPRPTRPITDTQPEPPASNNMNLIIIGAVIFLAVGAVIFGIALASLGNGNADNDSPAVEPTTMETTIEEQPITATTDIVPTSATSDNLTEGDTLIFEDVILTMNAVNSDVSSFLAATDTPYLIDEIVEDTEGQLWYRLLEEESNQTGWVAEADLPAYIVVRN